MHLKLALTNCSSRMVEARSRSPSPFILEQLSVMSSSVLSNGDLPIPPSSSTDIAAYSTNNNESSTSTSGYHLTFLMAQNHRSAADPRRRVSPMFEFERGAKSKSKKRRKSRKMLRLTEAQRIQLRKWRERAGRTARVVSNKAILA